MLNLETLISIVQRDNLQTLKYLDYETKLAPTPPQLKELQTIGKLGKTSTKMLDELEDVTPLTDYKQTAEAKLNEVLQQMKQLQQEWSAPEFPDEPETPDEPTPAPLPVLTPETAQPQPETLPAPQPPVETSETPETAAPEASTPEEHTFVADARVTQSVHSTGTLIQTGVNHTGVLGFALAGFGLLTVGVSMKLAARRGKHCKR